MQVIEATSPEGMPSFTIPNRPPEGPIPPQAWVTAINSTARIGWSSGNGAEPLLHLVVVHKPGLLKDDAARSGS